MSQLLPFSYPEVQEIYQQSRQVPGLSDLSFRDFSKLGNQVTGTELFKLGDQNPLMASLLDLNEAINYGLEQSGANDVGADVGGFIGKMVGNEELGREVGRSLPRGVANTLPLFAGPVGLAVGGGSAALDAFSQTGSGPRAALAGGLTAAFPAIINKGSTALLNNGLGNALTQRAITGVPTRFATNVGAGFGADVAADVGDIALAPERELNEVLTSEYWQTRAVANAAFVPFDAVASVKDQVASKVRKESVHKAVDNSPIEPLERLEVGRSLEEPVVELELLPEAIADSQPLDPISPPTVLPGPGQAAGPFSIPSGLPPLRPGDAEFGKSFQTRVEQSLTKPLYEIIPYVPKDATEYKEQVSVLNTGRDVIDLPDFNKGQTTAKSQTLVEEGFSPDVAATRVLQSEKFKLSQRLRDIGDNSKLGDDDKAMALGLEALANNDPNLRQVVDLMHTRILKRAGDSELLADFQQQWREWYDTYQQAGVGSLEGLRSRLKKATERYTRRKKTEKTGKKQVGRKSNLKKHGEKLLEEQGLVPEDFDAEAVGREATLDAVAKLPQKQLEAVMGAYNDFLRRAEQRSWIGDSGKMAERGLFEYMETVRAGSPVHPKQVFKKIAERAEMDNQRELARRGITLTEDMDLFQSRDGREALEEGTSFERLEQIENGLPIDDGEFQPIQDGFSPLRLQQTQRNLFQRLGHTPAAARGLSDAAQATIRLFKKLTGDTIALGDIINSTEYRGLARLNKGVREVFLNDIGTQKVRDAVVMHEVMGHHFDDAFQRGQLDPATSKAYQDVRDFFDTATPAQRAEILDQLAETFLDKKTYQELSPAIRQNASSFDESIANLNMLIGSSLKIKSNKAELRYLPQAVRRYAEVALEWVTDMFQGARSFMKWRLLESGVGKENVKALEKFSKELNVALKQDELELLQFAATDTMLPGGIDRLADAGVVDASRFKGTPFEATAQAMFVPKKVRDAVGKAVMPQINKLNAYPSLKKVQYQPYKEQATEHLYQRELNAILFGDTSSGQLRVPRDGGPIGRIAKNQEGEQQLNDLLLRMNEEGVNFLSLPETDSGRYQTELAKFPKEVRADVPEAIARLQEATQYMNRAQEVTFVEKTVENYGTLLRRAGYKGTQDELRELSKQAVEMYRQARVAGDIGQFVQFARTHGLDMEVAETFLGSSFDTLAQMQQYWDANPHYVNERRWGRYHVSFSDGKENGRYSSDNLEDAIAFAKEARDSGMKLFYEDNGVRDMRSRQTGRRSSYERYVDMLDTAFDRTALPKYQKLLADGKIDQEAYDGLVGNLEAVKSSVSAEVNELGLADVSAKRKFAAGREYMNMVQQHLTWLQKLSRRLPRAVTDAVMEMERHNPEIANNAEHLRLFEESQQGLRNFRVPDTKTGQLITTANFLKFLGFNTRNMLVELTQFPFNLSPMLSSKGATLAQSYELPSRAAEWIANKNVTGRYDTGVSVDGKDMGELLVDYMDKRGMVGLGQYQELADNANMVQMDLSNMDFSNNPLPLKKRWWTKPIGAYTHLATKLYGLSAGFNEKVSVMSAFELIRKQDYGGKSDLTKAEFDAIIERAVLIGKSASGGFGRANRPVGWFSTEGGWRSVSQATYSLNGYNSSHLTNLWNYIKVGLSKDLEGFTPTEKKAARRAAIQAFSTMTAAVGVIGAVPFAGALMRLIEDNSELELEKNTREFFASLGDEDSGPIYADFAMHGSAYAAGVPMDFSSYIAPGGLLGANSYDGWSPQALMGPAFNHGKDLVDATVSAFKGDWTKATESALPNGLKRLYSLYLNEGNVTDKEGNVLIKPNTSEQIAVAAGFPPRRLTMLKERQRLHRTATRIQQERNERIYKEAAELHTKQGPGAARRYLMKHANETVGFDQRVGTSKVAQKLHQQQHGLDPRRIGSVQGGLNDRAIAQTFDFSGFSSQTEPERVMEMMQLMLSMGVPPRDLAGQLKQALLVESLQQNSGLPYQTARALNSRFGSREPGKQQFVQGFLPF